MKITDNFYEAITQHHPTWYMVQLNYNFTIPYVNLHGSLKCHGWLLLRGIRVPRLLTLHERGTMQLFYALW